MKFTVPQGFRFSTAAAGFKKQGRDDLGLIVSDAPASAAGVFTKNLFQAAPVTVARQTIKNSSTVKAVVMNSGQANACTGEQGIEYCKQSLSLVAQACNLKVEEILPASTGVIGMQLLLDKWKKAVPQLNANIGKKTAEDFAKAIMTTDAFHKMAGKTITLSGGDVTLLGIAKGAGMICPNMATMLSVVLCDVGVDSTEWQKLFNRAVEQSFNRVTVDGDTSTNDTLFGLANGASGVTATGADLEKLYEGLVSVLCDLAYMLVQDGEGATKVMRIIVKGAKDNADAEKAARTIGHSQLVKTAMYGKDANWGRIVAALGRSDTEFNPHQVCISFCGVPLFEMGKPSDTDFDTLLVEPLRQRDLLIEVSLGNGLGMYELLASDLTHAYIDCNASYRS